jgi:uncharacterized protein
MVPTLGHGKICYLVIPALDINASANFYEAAFGWEIRQRGDGSITFNDGVGQVSGAWVAGLPAHTQIGLMVFIMVEDAAATLEKLSSLGAEIVQPIGADSPEITARFRDPAGNLFGIYQNRG